MIPDERPVSREVVDLQFQVINNKLDQILVQATTTNGRVRAAEKAIAVLSWAYGIAVVVIGWLVTETIHR